MSLRFKLFSYFIAATLVPLAIGIVVVFNSAAKALQERTVQLLETTAEIEKNRINDAVDEYLNLVNVLPGKERLGVALDSYVYTKEDTVLDSLARILQEQRNTFPGIKQLSLYDTNGHLLVTSGSALDTSSKRTLPSDWLLQTTSQFRGILKSQDQSLVVQLTVPIYFKETLVGLLEVVNSSELLLEVVGDYESIGNTGEIVLGKKNNFGDIVILNPLRYDAGAALERVVAKENKDKVAIVNTVYGENGIWANSDTVDYRGVPVMAVGRYIDSLGWGVVVKINRSEILAPVVALRYRIFLIMGSFYMVALLVWLLGTGAMLRSIRKLTEVAREFGGGNLDSRVKIMSHDEIGQLSSVFNLMADNLAQNQENLEKQIQERTAELQNTVQEVEESKRATLNVLEDLEESKKEVEHRQQEAELNVRELEKFKLAVENASDHVVITDSNAIILYANRAAERITGFSRQEMMGKKAGSKELWGGLMPPEFYARLWKTVKIDKKPFGGEVVNHRKNGEKYTALGSISPILDKNGEVVFFVALERDITEEKRIDKAKTEFVSLASHQLRTPLSAINWYAEMLLNGDAGKLRKEQKTYVDEIYQGNQRMVALVNALLNVSRIDLGTFAVEPEEVSVVATAQSVIAELKPQIIERKLRIEEKYDLTVPLIKADPKLLRIVFQNLISNAVKYTPEKGMVTVAISLDKTVSKTNKSKGKDGIIISIADTGFGIPQRQAHLIFTKLFRADNVREKETEGTGLGLYIVKSIVDQTGGRIWFESEENKGTVFYVTLPLVGMAAKQGTKTLS